MVKKPVQMRLSEDTLERIERLKETTGVENRTQIVTSSLAIAEVIISSVKEDKKIYIQEKNGKKQVLTLVVV